VKTLSSFLIGVVFFFFAPHFLWADGSADISSDSVEIARIVQQDKSIVHIAASLGDGYAHIGSGVVVGDKYVITAGHVVDGAGTILVNGVHQASVVVRAQDDDLALLHVPDLEARPLPLLQNPLFDNEVVVAIGYPERDVCKAFPGGVIETDNRLVVTSASVYEGQSGGALLALRTEAGHSTWYVAGVIVAYFVEKRDGIIIKAHHDRSVSVATPVVASFIQQKIAKK